VRIADGLMLLVRYIGPSHILAITKTYIIGTERLGSVPYTIINETVGAKGEPQLKLRFPSCSCGKTWISACVW
jgi:hypothetical protein